LRAPWTIWTHLTAELLKLLLITTGVLVAVLSFAATVKFLADGKLQAADALKYMGYAMPPMLAYALPFAACFAATLVYHRFATDNEAQAAASGGISHRSLLVPAMVIGLGCAGTLVALNEEIIPRFLRRMERLVKADVPRLLTNHVERGEALQLGRRMIFADQAVPVPPEPGSDIINQLVLKRAVLIETDETGKPIAEGTADLALVALSRVSGDGDQSRTRLTVRMKNMVALREGKGLASNELTSAFSVDVPDAFEDDPKFLTHDELRGLRAAPERMNWIDRLRRDVALRLARAVVADELDRELRAKGRVSLKDPEGRVVEIEAAGVGDERAGGESREISPGPGGRVVVTRQPGSGQADRIRFSAAAASLQPASRDEFSNDAVEFQLVMSDVRSSSVSPEGTVSAGGVYQTFALGGLIPANDPAARLVALPVATLVDEASKQPDSQPAAAELKSKVDRLGREITSKQHERMALALCCLVMVVTGSVTALRLSLRLPLTVYLWSFFPALVSIVTISGGQQLTHNNGDVGLFLLWGGVGMLGMYTLLSFRAVARH
jgi:lipopolysaccharide export LptBFGC system permease protein LptF